MLDANIIEPSDSVYSSPIVLVKKKDGNTRVCIDYRKLNAVTKKVSCNMSNLEDIITSFSEQKPTIFSLIDLRAGYQQIPMATQEDMDKTSFTSSFGHYRFRSLPFGLLGAPSTFNLLMNKVFHGINYKICSAYMDDILVYSRGIDAHLCHLREVFSRLRAANLKIHNKKTFLGFAELSFLGFRIDANGIAVDEKKIAAIANYESPSGPKEKPKLQRFLGMVNYQRKHIKNYAQLCAPLNDLLKKDNAYRWTPVHERAFQAIKTAMCSAPVLAFPRNDRGYNISIDASKLAVAYLLSQKGDDGLDHLIYAGGRQILPREAKYSATELEALALVECLKHCKSYLANGHPHTVYT